MKYIYENIVYPKQPHRISDEYTCDLEYFQEAKRTAPFYKQL